MIRLYLKIPNNFVRLIFLDGFWVVHKPFAGIYKIPCEMEIITSSHLIVYDLVV